MAEYFKNDTALIVAIKNRTISGAVPYQAFFKYHKNCYALYGWYGQYDNVVVVVVVVVLAATPNM
ncbi:hypothetical protein BpHYR1_001158 [Brachionus plicatilis]|uniref:Uncharacterized protein n=1 Tax=Brachionus plicatilis TaxID=10195 RepID=A0A3M7RKT3_BRAPC|nr:hypothetical protein BpHYR1_001158 [Brachionus plicatilis]